MKSRLQVLSEDERVQVHERALALLRKTGVRVDSPRGRRILAEAGAEVDENIRRVRLPESLVRTSLQAAPKTFSLGGRRPNWSVTMNQGECVLGADGAAVHVLDAKTGERRPGTFDDLRAATCLIDALDEIGVYWCMIDVGVSKGTHRDAVARWRDVFANCSKHIQESTESPQETRWLLEVLQVIFGTQESVRRLHPFSFLLCPLSPLILEESPVEAYLETAGWEIPIAVMPMPLMGASAPASLISTLTLANAEVLAVLCLVQSAMPGTPFLYAPVPALVNPRSWRFGGGEIEHSLLGAGATEMARFYGLPAEVSTGGTDEPTIGVQGGYETALNWLLPTLSWPDVLIGPGLLAGSTVLSLEQLLIDIEVFRLCARLQRGIESDGPRWLDTIIESIGPGGNFLGHRSTREALHRGEWYMGRLGFHDTYERWESAGRPDVVQEARDRVNQILSAHTPLPLDEDIQRELDRIGAHAGPSRQPRG